MFHKMSVTAEKASLLSPTKFKTKCDGLQQPAGSQEKGAYFKDGGDLYNLELDHVKR